MKRSPSELRENTTLTGEEQVKNDNLTVEDVSKKVDFLDLDFLNEQKTNRRTNRERTKRNCKN